MKPHPRIRKTIKWGGAAVTVLLVVVWIGSCRWGLNWDCTPGKYLGLRNGAIRWSSCIPEDHSSRPVQWYYIGGYDLDWQFHSGQGNYGANYCVPLWIPIGMLIGITTGAWRLDTLARRRDRLGRCPKCNYDRAGLAKDAVCPECGSKGPFR
jgi:hypothetical protein